MSSLKDLTSSTPVENRINEIIPPLFSKKSLESAFGMEQKTLARILLAASVAKWTWDFVKELRDQKTTVVTFVEGEEVYDWFIRWLLEIPESHAVHNFEARIGSSSCNSGGMLAAPVDACSDESVVDERLKIDLVPSKSVTFKWRGVDIVVNKGGTDGVGKNESGPRMRFKCDVTLFTRDQGFLVDWMMDIQKKGQIVNRTKEPPMVYVHSNWYGWRRVKPCPPGRSVIMPDGIYDRLKQDLVWFLQNRLWYESVGIPYTRGYLLYGIPGSGKTSTVLALAGDLQKSVYVLNISELDDSAFLEALSRVPTSGILVIEDVDAAFRQREATEENKKLTFSGLLNGLDGIIAPEGRILFMTTNHLEMLDAALIRPGRVDKKVPYGPAEEAQIKVMCLRFGLSREESEKLSKEWAEESVSMSGIQERLIQRHHNITL